MVLASVHHMFSEKSSRLTLMSSPSSKGLWYGQRPLRQGRSNIEVTVLTDVHVIGLSLAHAIV